MSLALKWASLQPRLTWMALKCDPLAALMPELFGSHSAWLQWVLHDGAARQAYGASSLSPPSGNQIIVVESLYRLVQTGLLGWWFDHRRPAEAASASNDEHSNYQLAPGSVSRALTLDVPPPSSNGGLYLHRVSGCPRSMRIPLTFPPSTDGALVRQSSNMAKDPSQREKSPGMESYRLGSVATTNKPRSLAESHAGYFAVQLL